MSKTSGSNREREWEKEQTRKRERVRRGEEMRKLARKGLVLEAV